MFSCNVNKRNVDNENEKVVIPSMLCLPFFLDFLLKVKNLTSDLEITQNLYFLKMCMLLGGTSFRFGTYYGKFSIIHSKI